MLSKIPLAKMQKQSPRGVLQKDVIKNFEKFTEKHLRPATLLIKDSDTGVFTDPYSPV